ncbi:L,D-transpeptidase [Haloferula sp. A504]|uniref:L,D-transpeptidase n=1 Tax=Haloferula sp. A504 TaxID=3373601 RepID=UPI0031BCF18E|nr:L,D-transpeptidase [Verrucomicrobiaceae bacterium E54]
MNFLPRILALSALAAAAIGLSSCGNMSTGTSGTSFSYKPKVTQPTNRSAVKVKISTSAGRLYVVEGDKVLLATPCGVGKAGSPTPAGNHRITSKTKERRRQSQPGRGYPMTYWMSFYSPAYGMHWGFVKPYPSTMGCVRLPLNSAREIFNMVRVGTPVNVSSTQPWDSTIGASLPVLDDSPLPNPPMSYMLSPQVFKDAEQGKMWQF